jgi:hypothetical protein
MFTGKYGPFAEIITIAAALVAVFSLLLLKAVGKVSQWTWLIGDAPSFVVTAGARAVAIALIALSFIFIDKTNYGWFGVVAAAFAIVAALLIGRFNHLRMAHICKVPALNANGSQATTFFGSPKYEQLVIGDENNMTQAAAEAYKQARPVSLCKFMSGYGRNRVNDPEAIWSKVTLARISNAMTMALMGILLCAVMALYLAASSIEVHLRPTAGANAPDKVTGSFLAKFVTARIETPQEQR